MSKGEINANIAASPVSMFAPKPTKQPNINSASYRESQLLSFLKEMTIAEYHVSFGNVVANHKASLTFTVTNLNKGALNFTIDKKELSAKGYTVGNGTNNDRCFIEEGKSLNITVTHNTSSTNANIDVNNVMKLVMSNGECYEIHLHSFVSIPNL